MTRTLTIFISLTIHLASFGQHDFGLKANCGLSYLSTRIFQTGSPQTMQKFSFMPSGQGGLFYNFHFGKSLIGTEILFVQIEGKEHDQTPATGSYGIPTGQFITGDNSRHISYLSIPIYYGYSYKKLSINIGVQTSFALFSSVQTKSQAPDGNGGTLNFNLNSDKLPIKDYDFGARTGLSFALTKKLAVEATYYYGLLNIYKYNPADFAYKIQQMTIGLKYKFISTSETENK